jgi:hypothetical protein
MARERRADERERREGDVVSPPPGEATPRVPNGGRASGTDDTPADSATGGDERVSRTQWDEVSFIISSQYRIDVIERLSDGPATPSGIASDSDNSLPHVSRALQELRDRSFVELLVSEDRKKGRVYGITKRAEGLWETIQTEKLA